MMIMGLNDVTDLLTPVGDYIKTQASTGAQAATEPYILASLGLGAVSLIISLMALNKAGKR